MPPAVFGALSYLVCWLSLLPADPLLVRWADLLLALTILNPSVCLEGWRKQKKQFAREAITLVDCRMPSGVQRELKRITDIFLQHSSCSSASCYCNN